MNKQGYWKLNNTRTKNIVQSQEINRTNQTFEQTKVIDQKYSAKSNQPKVIKNHS